jgi:hypothetical protein
MCAKWGILSVVVLFAGLQSCSASNRLGRQTFKGRIRFLATTTSIRSSWAGNQDIYLATIQFQGRGDEAALARVIDEYPSYRVAIPSEVLASSSSTSFRLRRDRSCDVAYGLMSIRTAPGDAMAILPEPFSFRPALSEAVQPADIIPCYRIVRR